MSKTIITAPSVEMESLKNLFIEMTAQNCNLRCKNCYINFTEKRPKDFISIDKIRQTLAGLKTDMPEFIHLTGAEPMLHPDFNLILRLCLKYSSVVIHTNALNINDKKARFLRKVEEENNLGHEIVFMISIDHYKEEENDKLRGRGSYRKAVHAIQSLCKYEFNPILAIVNQSNMPVKELKMHFKELCSSIDFETTDMNFKIIPLMKRDYICENDENTDYSKLKLECKRSRTLTVNGIFTCPLLASDNRGKCGNDINDYSKKNYLETAYCSQCIANNEYLFSFV